MFPSLEDMENLVPCSGRHPLPGTVDETDVEVVQQSEQPLPDRMRDRECETKMKFTLEDPAGKSGAWLFREICGKRAEWGGGPSGVVYAYYSRCAYPAQILGLLLFVAHSVVPELHGPKYHGHILQISVGIAKIIFFGRSLILQTNGPCCAKIVAELVQAAAQNSSPGLGGCRGAGPWKRKLSFIDESPASPEGRRARLKIQLQGTSKQGIGPFLLCQILTLYLCGYGIMQACASNEVYQQVFFICFALLVPISVLVGNCYMGFADFLLMAVCKLAAFEVDCFGDELEYLFRIERFTDAEAGLDAHSIGAMVRRDLISLAPRQRCLDNVLREIQRLWSVDMNAFFLMLSVMPMMFVITFFATRGSSILDRASVLVIIVAGVVASFSVTSCVEEPGNAAYDLLDRLSTSQMVVDAQGIEMLNLMRSKEYGLRVYGHRVDFRSKYGALGVAVAFTVSVLTGMLFNNA